MEGGAVLKQKVGTDEVVLMIPNPQQTSKSTKQIGGLNGNTTTPTILESTTSFYSYSAMEQGNVQSTTVQMSTSSSSPATGRLSSSVLNPPSTSNQPPSETSTGSISIRRRPLAQFRCPKPKSRLVEPPQPPKVKLIEDGNIQPPAPTTNSPYRSPIRRTSTPNTPKTTGSITPKTPLMASPGYHEDQEDDDDDGGGVYQPGYIPDQFEKKRSKKVEFIILIEWIALFSILGFLIVSLTVDKLSSLYVSGLRIWRWCVLVLVFFCGHLVTQWFTELLVFVIERNYLLKNKVLYFLYSLRKSFRVSLWLGLVLIAWALLINRGVKRSRHTMRVLNHITRALASSLIGSVMWMVKTFLVKLLASSYHVQAFFDKIQESIFHQYVLQTLSGPALMENADTAGRFRNSGRLSFKYSMKGKQKGKGDEVVNVDKLYNLTREKISSFTMNGLVQVIRTSGLSTISDALERSDDDEEVPQKEIVSEVEAKAAARDIFKKVAKSGNRYIDEGDLLRFFPPEEVGNVLPLFEGTAQTGQIMKASFKSWVVKVYNERKYLAHSLNDAKTAVEELNKISSAIILVVIIIVWLLLMGFATTKVLVFISSQLLLVVFMFGNTAKTVFEAMVFVFGTHPFDVGDRCVVDGVQMIVEEMNILTTIFLRYDNQMIYYPNSILATKPITNFNRSPPLGDSVEFSVDFSTSVESIAALKAKLKGYLESKPEQWQPSHSVQIKEIEDVNKLKMALYVTHAINSSSSQRSSHRSDLVLELKKIFEVLQINYHLLPQEVHVRYVGSEFPPSNTY
ncbi:unnamed protein product [Coffea canephora]|uniref:Mechanosensitive ion channel protein n=1 Tax=Coffea canephora TaxID=49390 RepID=A0A068U3M3_COFCA|nr:unnamed protein product [Coffea canephora]